MCYMRKLFITRTRLYFTGTAIFIVILLLFIEQCVVKESNLPCHYSRTGDTLPSAEDPNFSPNAKSIFFHETSCRSGLTVRQACAVEAAARAHPNRQIYVLFSAPVTEYELKTGCLVELLQIPNVRFLRVHAAEYSKGTAVQSILLNDLKHSRFQIQHTADILRILTLNKWGGIYLDTDMIVTRSLDELPSNFVAKETGDDVASAILAFAKDEIGTNVTNAVIKKISTEYNPSLWSAIGADAIEEVLRRLCPKDLLKKPINDCKGVMIFDRELFYPQYFLAIDDIFDPAPENFDLMRPYTYHMWDFLSFNRKISRGTVYELVAKAFCPTIHSTGLTVRQACAVEAAARAHSKREIYVLFSTPVTAYELKTSCLAKLLRFPKVKFGRVHEAEYSKGIAVQSMLLNDVKHSRYKIGIACRGYRY